MNAADRVKDFLDHYEGPGCPNTLRSHYMDGQWRSLTISDVRAVFDEMVSLRVEVVREKRDCE